MRAPSMSCITSTVAWLTGVATLFVTTFLLQRLLRWVGTGNVYLWVGVVYVLIALMLLGMLLLH